MKYLIATMLVVTVGLAGCRSTALPEISDQEFLEMVAESQSLAYEWLTQNVKDNGVFLYSYNPVSDTESNTNNALRQLMSSRSLAVYARAHAEALVLHRTNLQFIMEQWYREEGNQAYIYFDDKSKLGANAMLLRTFVASPDRDSYQTQADYVANGILSLINDEYSLRPWYIEPNYEYDHDYLLTFYSGEALLALVEYAQAYDKPEVLEIAKRVQDVYIEKYVTQLKDNYYPAYVPWHIQSLSALYKITNEQKYVDAIFVLADKVLELQDTKKYIGRFYNPKTPEYGSPHSSSDAVYTEGIAYAYGIAFSVNDQERVERYKQAMKLGVYNITQLQYSAELAKKYTNPSKVTGAIRINHQNYSIRSDTTQHALDAYSQILEVIE